MTTPTLKVTRNPIRVKVIAVLKDGKTAKVKLAGLFLINFMVKDACAYSCFC